MGRRAILNNRGIDPKEDVVKDSLKTDMVGQVVLVGLDGKQWRGVVRTVCMRDGVPVYTVHLFYPCDATGSLIEMTKEEMSRQSTLKDFRAEALKLSR